LTFHGLYAGNSLVVKYRHFRGKRPPRFAHESERELAELLDEEGPPWDYEPRTFPLEHGPDGRLRLRYGEVVTLIGPSELAQLRVRYGQASDSRNAQGRDSPG
jgi:hypothetical protein